MIRNRSINTQICPTDILKLIFEQLTAPYSPASSFEFATAVSHVCHHWRMVALDTPRIWSDIICDLKKDAKDIKEFWERTTTRVKRVTTTVVILNIRGRWDQRLRHCKLNNFHRIDRLTIQILDFRGLSALENPSFVIPSIPIPSLHLKGGPIPFPRTWDCANLLGRFSSMENLCLEGFPDVLLSERQPFPSVKGLILGGNNIVNLRALPKVFSSLTMLEFNSRYIVGIRRGEQIAFANLTYLKFTYTANCSPRQWLTQLSCPSLVHLVIQEEPKLAIDALTWSQELEDFLRIHPSIITLSLPNTTYIDRVSKAAPQIRHLLVYHLSNLWYLTEPLGNNATPIFPFLKTLSFSCPGSCPWGDEEFEGLVRHRCLPRAHPNSLLVTRNPLDCIHIQKYSRENLECTWKKLPLFAEATKTVLERDGDDVVTMMLSWVWFYV